MEFAHTLPARAWTYVSLFTGVGGFELAASRLGGRCVAMAEQDKFCQRVLRRRFPGVPIFDDVRDVGAESIKPLSSGRVTGVVGGFPCQDVSSAGKGEGIKGKRSGMWVEMHRVIVELRPRFALIENVAQLKTKGLSTVLRDLYYSSFDAEWDIISAASVGAPHLRERIWIVARPMEETDEWVYGVPTGKTVGLEGKLPRAGRMTGGVIEELVPLAPRKTKRKDGWSYWTGPLLFGDSSFDMYPTPHGLCSPNSRQAGPSGNELGFRVNQVERGLWGTPNAHPRTFDPRQVDHGVQLANQVAEVERSLWPTPNANGGTGYMSGSNRDTWRPTLSKAVELSPSGPPPPTATGNDKIAQIEYALLPTPTPTSHVNGNSPENHMRKKEERCGGPRGTISDLSVLIRNDLRQPNGMMWPTATARDWKDVGDLDRVDENGLLPRYVHRVENGSRMMPTPTPTSADGSGGPGRSGREGGDNLRTAVQLLPSPRSTDADRGGRGDLLQAVRGNKSPSGHFSIGDVFNNAKSFGSMSATWVEWVMCLPLWWTDPDTPTEFTTQVGWDHEPLDVAPRLVVGERNRANRLRAIGNSLVWPCAYYSLRRALLSLSPGP